MIWRWIFTQPYLSGGVSRTLLTNYKLKWKPKLILDTKAKTTIHNRRIFVNTFPCCIGKARVSASNKIAKKFPIFVSHHGNGDN